MENNGMQLIKCKMCGGDISVEAGQNYGTCDSCGSTMTLPSVSDERRANLFNRANHFRRLNDFDKALAAYESILNEDNNDAEAHWGVALCRYGIEYVEDPITHKMIPTCHRAQYESILSDADYLAAVEHAPDGYSRGLYEEEAKAISEIQKGILVISQSEEPFDVFICYKETTDGGSRTKDSAIAQDIYYQLTQEGYRVFFSRITLEDKLGSQYEPYIFSALNSAKVMLVVGTAPEYFNAVWVKNEWSRYLALLKKDSKKLLIPCYQGMDAYDLPQELSMFQSQDMSKIGFIQDLIRGVKKVIDAEPQSSQSAPTTSGTVQSAAEPLVKRAFIMLEDKEWDKADDLLEQALNSDPENAQAYIGKLMVERKASHEDDLKDSHILLADSKHFRNIVRYGNAEQAARLNDYEQVILAVLEGERIADEVAAIEAKRHNEQVRLEREAEAKKRRKRIKKAVVITTSIFVVAIAIIAFIAFIKPAMKYSEAEALFASGNYSEAVAAFTQLGDYKDARGRVRNARERNLAKVRNDIAPTYIISAGRWNTAGLKSDGTVVAVGQNDDGQCDVDEWRDIVAISLGSWHIVGLNSDGTVVSVGANFAGQRNVSGWRDVIAISADEGHTAGLKSDGTAVAVGDNHFGQCDVDEWRDIVAVSVGIHNTIGLKSDGTVVAVGNTIEGQCDVSGWRDVVAISAGFHHTVGLKSDGTVVAVGRNDDGQCDVDEWWDIIAVSAGYGYTVGLKSDGTVLAVGNNDKGQRDVSGWRDIVAVSASDTHTVGLKSDGTVVAVGDNREGQNDVDDWDLW
jgi:tetratricopeptide (TPR) repeat protein